VSTIPSTGYPAHMADGVPVITAPAEIDITTADQLQAVLSDWRTRGHATVVVDMTGTQFCDSAALTELARAHRRAAADGGGLRLVISADDAVLRVFTLIGLDRVIPRFASLEQALAQSTAAVVAPGSPPARAGGPGPADDRRSCEQCGAVFKPPREHAPFCSADCRAAWNREHLGDPAVEASTLTWSVTAMSEATARLAGVTVWERPQAVAAIGEAVWWITMVDATLMRHHPQVYDAVLTSRVPGEQLLIEQTLAGLRFVRNRMGRDGRLGTVIEAGGPRAGNRRITGWTWKPVPEPALARLAPHGQAWEMSDVTVPGLPVLPGGLHRRGDHRPGRDVRHAHRLECGTRHQRQRGHHQDNLNAKRLSARRCTVLLRARIACSAQRPSASAAEPGNTGLPAG
jgi:anti-anti-sigma factor